MKRVLLQDNFQSSEYINSLKDLLNEDISNPEIDLDFSFCLDRTTHNLLGYNLIISHPHLESDCCLPVIKKALQNNIKVVLLYKSKRPHGEAIRAIAKSLNLDILYRNGGPREDYQRAIEKYLLEK